MSIYITDHFSLYIKRFCSEKGCSRELSKNLKSESDSAETAKSVKSTKPNATEGEVVLVEGASAALALV